VRAVTEVGMQFVRRDEVPPFEFLLIFVKGRS